MIKRMMMIVTRKEYLFPHILLLPFSLFYDEREEDGGRKTVPEPAPVQDKVKKESRNVNVRLLPLKTD